MASCDRKEGGEQRHWFVFFYIFLLYVSTTSEGCYAKGGQIVRLKVVFWSDFVVLSSGRWVTIQLEPSTLTRSASCSVSIHSMPPSKYQSLLLLLQRLEHVDPT